MSWLEDFRMSLSEAWVSWMAWLTESELCHAKYFALLDKRRFLAPIGAHPKNILDLGCGTGIIPPPPSGTAGPQLTGVQENGRSTSPICSPRRMCVRFMSCLRF